MRHVEIANQRGGRPRCQRCHTWKARIAVTTNGERILVCLTCRKAIEHGHNPTRMGAKTPPWLEKPYIMDG